jgi:hypothetical protein
MKLKFLTLIVLVISANLSGCSIYLEYVGWLDAPEQVEMYSSSTRSEFETISGEAIYSKPLPNVRIVRAYEYFDGEKCVNTSYHECDKMSRDRAWATGTSVMTAGVFEPIAYWRAIGERKEGKVQVFVIYDINDFILAICPSPVYWPSYDLQPSPLCESLGEIKSMDIKKEAHD